MALIMLAVGGLLTLIGVYAVATGLPVIEIERGWAMVISGSVLLSGGLIVAALGLVVRTLNGLRGGFVAQPVVSSSTSSPAAISPAAAPFPHDAPAIATPAFAVRPPAPVPAPSDGVPAFAMAAPAVAAVLGAGYAAAHREPEPHEPPAEPAHTPEPEADAPRAHEPASGETPAPPPADHAPSDGAAADPLSHDWLEKEFAAFDLDAPRQPPPAHAPEPPHEPEPAYVPEPPEADPPAPQAETNPAPEAEPPASEPVAHTPEPEPEPEAPSTAPEAPDGALSVIGRYDSDGTSYVMYSDGSIEAQSESGVFRFSSMAELKAFIEG